MYLYDQVSDVDWFYDQARTADEMRAMPEYSALFREPCVVYDNGNGRAYRYEPLADLAARWAVPQELTPDEVFSEVSARMAGTYKAPGVEQAQQTADEAKAIAEKAGTAAASVDEYMDALLGLDATNETEATDAE